MKRTTIYLEPELEVLLKIEMQRAGRPMAEIVRAAVRAYVTRTPLEPPPAPASSPAACPTPRNGRTRP